MHSGHVIALDGACSLDFVNELARNVVIFGVVNSSSSHADNCKNNFLVLGESPSYGINGSLSSPEKKTT